MNIHEECLKAGIPIDNHESDLYIPVNEFTMKLIRDYEFKSNVRSFMNKVTKTLYYDIPFAYMPFWELE